MNPWLAGNLVECLGWALLHFVWQGALVAALLAATLRLLRRAAPNRRYLAGCAAMLLLALAPMATFYFVARQYELPASPRIEGISAPAGAKTPVSEATSPAR